MLEENINTKLNSRPYLVAVQLLNCQSHENTVYEFAIDKINIIRAPNNTGKSVLFKMLAVTVDPKAIPAKKRAQLISYDAQFARVGYCFSDDTMGYCEVWPTQVIYYWRDSGEDKFRTSYEPPHELLWRLSVLLDAKEHSIANLIDNDQNLLLVDSNEKANHKLLKIVTENERLNELKEKLTSKYDEYVPYSSELNSELRLVECQIENLKKIDVVKLQQTINESEALNRVLYTVVDIITELQGISSLCSIRRDFTSLIKAITTIEYMAKMRRILDSIKISKRVDEYSIKLVESISMLGQMSQLTTSITSKNTTNLENASKLLELLNSINISNLVVQKDDTVEKKCIVMALEKFNAIMMSLRKIVSQDNRLQDALGILDPIHDVISIKQLVQQIAINTSQAKLSNTKINDYVQILQENNAIVECGVYGRAIFNGKECSPLGD